MDNLTIYIKVAAILLLMLIGGIFVNRIEKNIIARKSKYLHIDRSSAIALSKLLKILIYITGFLIILPTLGISISGILALGGIGGIAVGFAANAMIANFLGGAMLHAERPFAIGDLIESSEKDITGTVLNIGWRSTKILRFDGSMMYVPNSIFSTINIINKTRRSNRRIYETIGLRYCDAEHLQNIISDLKIMLESHPDIDKKETIYVGLNKFADSSLNCLIWCFTNKITAIEYFPVLEDILFKTLEIIKKNGADLAYPTSTVNLLTNNQ